MNKYFLVFFFILLVNIGHAQNYVLSGRVLDSGNSEAISFAQVFTAAGKGVLSNNQGYFSLNINPLEDEFVFFSALGYESDTIVLRELDSRVNTEIRLRVASLQTIVVAASKPSLQNFISPSIERLKNVPVVLGQTDVIKSLTIYPGVAQGREGLTGIYVRGGSDDQNLYLLDGSTIYNPGHLYGFLSVFNPNLVRSIDFYKNYIPAAFGKRLSSTVNIQTKQGGGERTRSRETGILGFNYTDVGRFKDSTLTYAGGVRFSHTALVTLGSLPTFLAKTSPLFFAGMYDVNFKIAKKYSSGKLLIGSVYFGDDLYGLKVPGKSEEEGKFGGEAIYRYGNKTASLRLFNPSRNGRFQETLLNFTQFRSAYNIRESFRSNTESLTNTYENRGLINEFSLNRKTSLETKAIRMTAGVETQFRSIEPVRINYTDEGQTIKPAPFFINSFHIAGYVDANLELNSVISIDGGIRTELFANLKNDYQRVSFDPRASINLSLGEARQLSLSVQKLTQNVHAVNIVAAGLPATVWIPADDVLSPETSISYGLDYQSVRINEQMNASIYFRKMTGQVFLPTQAFTGSSNNAWQEDILSGGAGEAFGFELYYERTLSNRLLGSLSYTWSRSFRTFQEVNRGEQFPFDFDRPHDLLLNGAWIINSKWKLNTSFTFQSGRPVSISEGTGLNFYGRPRAIITKYNNNRFPNYHRLDVLMEKKTVTRRGKQGSLKFGLYNLYGNPNPLFFARTAKGAPATNPRTGELESLATPQIQSGSLFRFFPMLSYEIIY